MRRSPLPEPRPQSPRVAVRGAAAAFFAVLVACGGGGGGGGGFPAAKDLASVTPNPESAVFSSGAGDFAADYLRRTHFTELWVEIDHPVGRPPSPGVLELLEARLSERCDKPGGVTVFVDDAIPTVEFPSTLSVSDLEDLERAYRDHFSDLAAQRAVLYVIYVKGSSNMGGGGTQVLGLTYGGGSVAMFVDAAESSSPFQTTAEIEGTGLVHEAGHCLGLTGATVPMLVDHRDELHGYHDDDETSVMYWLIQVPLTTPNLGDPDFAQFDANSIADLHAFGGLGPLPAYVRHGPAPRFDLEPVARCRTCERLHGRSRLGTPASRR